MAARALKSSQGVYIATDPSESQSKHSDAFLVTRHPVVPNLPSCEHSIRCERSAADLPENVTFSD